MPNASAASGLTRPAATARLRVRAIWASMSRSMKQLRAFAPPEARAPPSIVTATSQKGGMPRAAINMAQSVVVSRSVMIRAWSGQRNRPL